MSLRNTLGRLLLFFTKNCPEIPTPFQPHLPWVPPGTTGVGACLGLVQRAVQWTC